MRQCFGLHLSQLSLLFNLLSYHKTDWRISSLWPPMDWKISHCFCPFDQIFNWRFNSIKMWSLSRCLSFLLTFNASWRELILDTAPIMHQNENFTMLQRIIHNDFSRRIDPWKRMHSWKWHPLFKILIYLMFIHMYNEKLDI